jgi:hypothetical protein
MSFYVMLSISYIALCKKQSDTSDLKWSFSEKLQQPKMDGRQMVMIPRAL